MYCMINVVIFFFSEQIAPIIGNFVDRHVKVYQGRALRVLEPVAVLHPTVLVLNIPKLTQSIKAGEAKRGVGVDKQLRSVLLFCILDCCCSFICPIF